MNSLYWAPLTTSKRFKENWSLYVGACCNLHQWFDTKESYCKRVLVLSELTVSETQYTLWNETFGTLCVQLHRTESNLYCRPISTRPKQNRLMIAPRDECRKISNTLYRRFIFKDVFFTYMSIILLHVMLGPVQMPWRLHELHNCIYISLEYFVITALLISEYYIVTSVTFYTLRKYLYKRLKLSHSRKFIPIPTVRHVPLTTVPSVSCGEKKNTRFPVNYWDKPKDFSRVELYLILHSNYIDLILN